MKIKTLPEDFGVVEQSDFTATGGPFGLYRLEKKSIGTPEAIQIVLHNWNLSRQQVGYGGLKDRHAETVQHITIFQGPRQNLEERSLRLTYLGQAGRAFGASDIRANKFRITLRGMKPDQRPDLEARIERLKGGGILNYFDDQRFGSLGVSKQFIGQPWCLGDYERTLFLAIAEPNSHDRPREKEQKEILRAHWGDWIVCKERLDRSHRRSIVTYLCDHPTDFRRAVGLIRIDLRSLYLAAFQSYLWNRWLSAILETQFAADALDKMDSLCGKLNVIRTLTPEQAESLSNMGLPLPSCRQKEWDAEQRPLLDAILAELGMDIHQVRLKYPRDTFFSKGIRACWLGTPDLEHSFQPDELHSGSQKLKLEFSLPRGCYATMIIKHLTQIAEEEPMDDNDVSTEPETLESFEG